MMKVPPGQLRDLRVDGAHHGGARQRDHPGDDHMAGHRPASTAPAHLRAGAEYGPRRHLRRRDREAEVRRAPEQERRRRLGGHAGAQVEVGQAAADRVDDAPATDVRAQRDRQGGEKITQSSTTNCAFSPLTTIARAITPIVFCASFVPWVSATKPGRDELQAAQRPGACVEVAADASRQAERQHRSQAETEQRHVDRRLDHLLAKSRPVHHVEATGAGDRGAGDAADQRVRRRGRQTRHHVTRFQVIAPTRPARIGFRVIAPDR